MRCTVADLATYAPVQMLMPADCMAVIMALFRAAIETDSVHTNIVVDHVCMLADSNAAHLLLALVLLVSLKHRMDGAHAKQLRNKNVKSEKCQIIAPESRKYRFGIYSKNTKEK